MCILRQHLGMEPRAMKRQRNAFVQILDFFCAFLEKKGALLPGWFQHVNSDGFKRVHVTG